MLAADDRRSLATFARQACSSAAPARRSSRTPRAPLWLCALALLALPAAAQDLPTLKPGLWEMERVPERITGKQAPPAAANRTAMCLDESVQRDMFAFGVGAMGGACSRHDLRRSGNRLDGDFVCDIGGSRVHSKSTIVLDGNTAYRTEIDTTYDPPFMGQTKSKMVVRARNVGPCKPGQRAGDVVMPNGHTMNMRDMMSGPHGGAHGTITPGASQKQRP